MLWTTGGPVLSRVGSGRSTSPHRQRQGARTGPTKASSAHGSQLAQRFPMAAHGTFGRPKPGRPTGANECGTTFWRRPSETHRGGPAARRRKPRGVSCLRSAKCLMHGHAHTLGEQKAGWKGTAVLVVFTCMKVLLQVYQSSLPCSKHSHKNSQSQPEMSCRSLTLSFSWSKGPLSWSLTSRFLLGEYGYLVLPGLVPREGTSYIVRVRAVLLLGVATDPLP